MSRNFFAKTGFLALTLGAIATSSFLNACSTPAQNQTQAPSPAATDASSMQGMDHSSMNHGNPGSMSMDLGPADAEFDLRFVDAMTPHHQGAVEMAKEAQQKSKRPEIQKMAADIIEAQDKEINQMKQWRQAWYPKASAEPVAYNSKMGHSMPMSQDQMKGMMMNMNLGAADAEFDLRFLNAMIPHHEGAFVMAQDALNKSKRPEIRQLAQGIIASQKAEIKQMQQWKQAWYKQ
ncbi:DUF305 domain-containing protein [Leptolyngbya sp. DQ-M1]|uniref:DUF305 domain-containing protein n=1 Tax=Leptolyngbya sp. DQ-M1 TaxID=2933920 RepID=UPI00329A456B